jgi:hypothetical protein
MLGKQIIRAYTEPPEGTVPLRSNRDLRSPVKADLP